MFQFYKQNIDPNNESFLKFVSDYLERNKVNVEKVSYQELYSHLHTAIQEYLHLRLGGSARRNGE